MINHVGNKNNLGPPRTKKNQIYADMIIKFIPRKPFVTSLFTFCLIDTPLYDRERIVRDTKMSLNILDITS